MTAKWIRRATLRSIAAVLPLILLGCNYNRQTAEFHELYESGDYAQAAQVVTQQADSAPQRDAVLLRLEEGAILRAAGQPAASNQAFTQADDMISTYDDEPDVKVSQEAIAAGVNQSAMDYRGYAYDKIVMDTYKALNDLELGDLDHAGVQFNRAYSRQQEAVQKFSQQIAANNQVQQQHQGDYDVSQAQSDPQFQASMNQQYSALNVKDLSAYANYVNPFTEYMRGVYLMADAEDASDLEKAATALRRAAGLMKGNAYLLQDAQLAEKLANGGHIDPTTYVVFETGLAPERDEVRINFPVYHGGRRGGQVDYIAAAFPFLRYRPCDCEQAQIETSTGDFNTAVVCDMDDVISQEFKNELPIVITRTLISTAIKAAAEYAVDQEQQANNNTASALLNAVVKVAVVETNHADLRTWKSLPKLFEVARFATPPDRKLNISIAGTPPIGLTLNDGIVNVVYVKCVGLGSPLSIRQFKLK
ncbi:MAG TPA: hypothetical protein VL992_19760 [Tepidisphaeraceae bacterium]|nr:hypothetical protein [Tepidisphaeraceae bacterium]